MSCRCAHVRELVAHVLTGRPDVRGLTEQMRVDAEGGGWTSVASWRETNARSARGGADDRRLRRRRLALGSLLVLR
jgi:hypothetical protein